ncbi:hypothetical protein J7U46_18290 [Pelomonas sp. V22]|uniref:hypothetical protein n=1 Tax=Pelomonas sp. V22 TaxID=2822139 RepID=UPI0024A93F48|nr:hypothetical protein [Pelomonas sp. V22]MDI4635018.1 hypothetical protein [Pelomonas sp. V22]
MPRALPSFFIAGLTLLAAASVHADAYDYVVTPYFGSSRPLVRLGWGAADKREISSTGQSLAVGIAPTSNWYTEAWVSWNRDNGRALSYNGWYWTNQFAISSGGRSEWALYTSIWKPDFINSGWTWSAGPMFQYAGDGFDLNLNLFVYKWLRPGRYIPAELQYQAQIKTLLAPGWEWGVQALGETGPVSNPHRFGLQEHLVGPALFGHRPYAGGSLRWDAGLLLGLNKESPRAQLRAQLGYQF